MPRNAPLTKLFLPAVAVITILGLSGCGGGGGKTNTAALSDEFQAISSGVWDVTASVATIAGKLQLTGTTESSADIHSGEAFLYRSMRVVASSNTWSAGTSVGFDTTELGIRRAVIINQGKLVIIDQAAAGTKTASVAIDGWNTIRSVDTAYTIKWMAGAVELYAGNTLAATYTGALVPSVPLTARFVCDTGKLNIDQISILNDTSAVFEDGFSNLNTAIWTVTKGSLATTYAGKLILRSTAQASAEVRSKSEFQFKQMDFTASGDWGSDSSIGFERPEPGGKYTIEVNNGNYRVSAPSGSSSVPIAGWTSIKDRDSAFRIKWQNGFSQLIVNNFLNGSYSGSYLATASAKVRFYAGTAQPGEMVVDSVLIKETL